MKRILLVVAYDGTNYHGWQIQNNAESVESVLRSALKQLLGENVDLIGASRTDAGVHAMGNVAVFDTESGIPADKMCFALNQWLPEDIRVQSSKEVPLDFHPRYAKTTKTYEYTIENSRIPNPLNRLYSYFVYSQLDIERMRAGAKHLIGEHDFASFCSAGSQVKTTVRTIYQIEIEKKEKIITIRIQGNGFLYNMVRIIAGTLIDMGKGYREPEEMQQITEAKERRAAGPTAPANGLKLVEISY